LKIIIIKLSYSIC